MKHKFPLKIKSMQVLLWRYFAIFTVLIVVVVSLVCFGILGSAYSGQARERIIAIGNGLSAFVDGKSSHLMVEIGGEMNRYAFTEGVDIFLVGTDGQAFIYTTEPSDDWDEIFDELSETVDGWTENRAVVYSSASMMNYVSCVTFNANQSYLFVRYPMYIMSESVRSMQIYIIVIAAVAIIVAFIISYMLARRISRPIRNISETAMRMAKGDYGVQFASAEFEEIAQLSESLNYAKDEIKKSDDFQKELLANVSHDLRTPLTMIKAYASMVKEISGDDPGKRNKHLQVIIDESDRLTGLVNDILNASKVSAGLSELNKKGFNLTDFIYGIMNKFDYLQETAGYKFYVDIDPNLYTLADEEKIYQVIYNLVSNAVNYTGADKCVYVSLKDCPEQSRIKFAVRDTGKGISDEEKEHIWDRYYRSKDAHARPVKGTGLGLNIVKIILQAHNFNFGVNSKEGEGSTFYVDFPEVSSTPDN